MTELLIAGENGKIWKLKNGKIIPCVDLPTEETCMGIAIHHGCYYYAAKTKIFMGIDCIFDVGDKDIHQIQIYYDRMYIVCTKTNEILVFNLNFMDLEDIILITPPDSNKPVEYKKNYNHINNITKFNNEWYVGLNWKTNKQYGLSGIAIYNDDMTEYKHTVTYGWEQHGLCYIDGRRWCLVGSSGGIHQIHHPDIEGLMIGDRIFWNHDKKWFCKDFSVNKEYIYVVGTEKTIRKNRKNADGVLFILRRDSLILEDEIILENQGGFCGCLLLHNDLTKL